MSLAKLVPSKTSKEEIRNIDSNCYIKLLRISGVYLNGDSNNEMIDRISGKAFNNEEELEEIFKGAFQ